jgi:hypothetical protein
MGKNAAGRMADRRCEKVGMRFTMEPVVCCGKSDARAIGRKAARKEMCAVGGEYCNWYLWLLSLSRSLARSLSSFRQARDETSSFRYSLTGGRRRSGTPLARPP